MDRLNLFQIAYNAQIDNYGEENLLTDSLAAFLDLDTQAARAWFHRLSGIVPSNLEVFPQPSYPNYPHGAPDLRLESPEMAIICEHKFDSLLGDLQLERYLALVEAEEIRTAKPHRLVLVAKNANMNIPAEVLKNDHYARPQSGLIYHRWQDFYQVLAGLLDQPDQPVRVVRKLREHFFRHLHALHLATLEMPTELAQIFTHQTPDEKQKQRAFAERWRQTQTWFIEKGYRCEMGSRIQLYIHPTPASEIPDHSGLSHLIAEPTVGDDLPPMAGFNPPVLEFNVQVEATYKALIDALRTHKHFKLEFRSLPVAVTRRSLSNGRIRISFAMPLKPLWDGGDLENDLFSVVTELYKLVLIPAWLKNQPV